MIDLNELKRLAEAATPGPWCWDDTVWDYDPKEQAPWLVGADDGAIILTGTIECKMKSNADFIAAANPAAILELIALASAAQDSAPAELPIKTWQERLQLKLHDDSGFVHIAMQGEIADLRAALAAAPVQQSDVQNIADVIMFLSANGFLAWRGTGDDEEDAWSEAEEQRFTVSEVIKAVNVLQAPKPVAKVLTVEQLEAIRHGAALLELEGYESQSADLFAIVAAASTPTTLTEKKE